MPVFVLLVLAVIAEVAVIVAVGNAIGGLTTVLLLIAVSMAGVALLRRQGGRTMSAFTEALRNRRDPSAEMTDGVLLGIAAGLVVFPGFLSDVAALFLLFPPTRAVVRRRMLRRAQARRDAFVARQNAMDGEVVDGEVVDAEPVVIDAQVIEAPADRRNP